jgi:DNA polymerase (family 10)
MNNADVAAALNEIAEILQLKKDVGFRVRAYENAARALTHATQDVRTLAAAGELKKVKGIGEGIAKRIEEMLQTGHMQYLDELRAEFPPGVRSLMSVPGVGPSLARRVYQELGVDNLDGLRQAAEDGRLAALPGLGEKSAENVIRALGRVRKRETRISIGKALPLVEELMNQLQPYPFIQNLTAGGSLRRWAPTIGDIDLLATSSEPTKVMETFVALPQVSHVLAQGPTKSSIISDNGLQVDLRILPAEAFGSLLQHFTGSREHNIELREYALGLGLSLSEYGIISVETRDLRTFTDEESFYSALELDYMPPELRQGTGEIKVAREGKLPHLIDLEDIRGDLHVHTDWSDGTASMEEMVAAARERGYEYVAITDHSSGAGMAGGAVPERLLDEIRAIRELDAQVEGIRVFAGCEVDIKRDGTLDFPDELLAQLDWVIASIHTGFNQDELEITARMVKAMENPYVRAIGHPTGRIIGRRASYALNLEKVFRVAAETGTALEINSFPERLDLGDAQARRAKELGVKLTINTDAHAPVHFGLMRYGVATARRAWATPGDVINTYPLKQLEKWLRPASP